MMNKSMNRFKLCDFRFHPFVRKVIERLPETVRENILNDRSFQIITDDDVFDRCVLRYEFGHPVKSLVYLNSKILMEPDHQIIHTIVSEIAHYVLKKEGTNVWEGLSDDLLIEWGFGEEVEAVHFDQAISESKGYTIGYEWAKKQSWDYLMQHFGLYFHEWNERGLGRMSSKGLNRLNHGTETDSIIDNVVQVKKEEGHEPAEDKILEKLSLRKAILAGILTAVKESTLNDFYSSKNSSHHPISC
jgi:hypothetical protein